MRKVSLFISVILLSVCLKASGETTPGIVEGQRGHAEGVVGDFSAIALTKRVVPRAGESFAKNEVVLKSYFVRKDRDYADRFAFVGVLLNNSIAGVYDIDLTLYFPVEGGGEKKETYISIYGVPAHVLTERYSAGYSPVSRDYIPPKQVAYFEESITLQENYDFSKVRYEVVVVQSKVEF